MTILGKAIHSSSDIDKETAIGNFVCILYSSIMSSGMDYTGIHMYSKSSMGVTRYKLQMLRPRNLSNGVEMTLLKSIFSVMRSADDVWTFTS